MSCIHPIHRQNTARRQWQPARWVDMTTLGSDRWQLKAWAGHARALALVFWAAAVLMTGVMGWSAWRAVDTATDSVDRIVARHEAGIVAKSRDIFITRR